MTSGKQICKIVKEIHQLITKTMISCDNLGQESQAQHKDNFQVLTQKETYMIIRKVALLICLLMTCIICEAKEITIVPQFAVGDTIRYRAINRLVMYHGKDSLVSNTMLQPTLIVEEKNDTGFVIKTTNRLDDFNVECSDPKAGETLKSFDKTDILNDFVAAVVLRIQLGANHRPDSILNMNAVKELMTEAYVNMFAKNQGIDKNNREEWEKETRPVLIGAVNMICTPGHLIDQQFGNLPYFNFTGIPLKSGKIPVSMILAGDLMKMCHGLKELNVEIITYDKDIIEGRITATDGMYSIHINGKDGKTKIEGIFLYGAGIMNHGILTIETESGSERLRTTYVLDPIE